MALLAINGWLMVIIIMANGVVMSNINNESNGNNSNTMA
jgi:hypothetical protein